MFVWVPYVEFNINELSTRSEGLVHKSTDPPGPTGTDFRVPSGRFIGGLFHGVQSHGVRVSTEGGGGP